MKKAENFHTELELWQRYLLGGCILYTILLEFADTPILGVWRSRFD